MISVLIPVYNFPVDELVRQLHLQLSEEQDPFEILVFDDGSTTFLEQYDQFERLKNLIVFKSKVNVGRSKARNLLAAEAQYDYLIFLDCDSLLAKGTFIKEYMRHRGQKRVVIGGRKYKKEHDANHELHWLYGVKRESTDQKGFKSNNFFIPKKVFQEVQFDESLRQYGHEDTLFGIHLTKKGIEIKHIENPVYHEGLEDNETFLRKSLLAVENAFKLLQEGKICDADIRLLETYLRWSSSRLGKLLISFIRKNESRWRKLCLSEQPRLYALDFLKICKMEQLSRNKTQE